MYNDKVGASSVPARQAVHQVPACPAQDMEEVVAGEKMTGEDIIAPALTSDWHCGGIVMAGARTRLVYETNHFFQAAPLCLPESH